MRINWGVLLSMVVCAALVFIGVVRFLSYLPEFVIGQMAIDSPFAFFAYQPGNAFNVSYIKVLSVPAVMAGIYFLYRLMNRGHNRELSLLVSLGYYDRSDLRTHDFKPLWLRAVLVSFTLAFWVWIEYRKIYSDTYHYPSSPLEDPALNLAVLLASGILSLVAMKHLDFGPLFEHDAERRARAQDRPASGGGNGCVPQRGD